MATPADTPARRGYMPAERQDIILNLLTRRRSVTVAELADALGTTAITVRRDLAALARAGLLRRVRGGAMSLSGAIRPDEPAPDETARPRTPDNDPAIGVMTPEPSFFWPGVIDRLRDGAKARGMRLVVRESSYGDAHERPLLRSLAEDGDVRGIICAPSTADADRCAWDWIEAADVPVVIVERDQPAAPTRYADSVCTDHARGARRAATLFLAHGHTRVGAAFTRTPTSAAIRDGWSRAVAGAGGITCPFMLDPVAPYDAEGVERVARMTLESNVTALFVHSDYLAIAVARALERHGCRIPRDVSMISVDGFATASTRPLTVLRSPADELAETALELLDMRMRRPDAPARRVFVDPELIDRGSVAAAAVTRS